MPRPKVYLVCGVPGSGKSWVCEQLKEKFTYIEHDRHIKGDLVGEVVKSGGSDKAILLDCPFAERELRQKLEANGFEVLPHFIVEHPDTVKSRYMSRDGKPLPKASVTRAVTISSRAIEWNAPQGTSETILKKLQNE